MKSKITHRESMDTKTFKQVLWGLFCGMALFMSGFIGSGFMAGVYIVNQNLLNASLFVIAAIFCYSIYNGLKISFRVIIDTTYQNLLKAKET